jgi:hypothetical protein
LAAGKRPVPVDSFGRGSIGIGGIADRDELEVVGVGYPCVDTAGGYLSMVAPR